MLVKDAMTTNVIGVESDASISQAIAIMLRSHVSALPVFSSERALVGILSEGDLLGRAELGTEKWRPRWLEFLLGPGRFAAAYVHTHGRIVGEVMTAAVVTVEQTATLAEAVDLMTRHHIKRLPVTSNGAVVGILARADLVRAMAAVLQTPVKAGCDAEIRDIIVARLEQQNWAPIASLDVAVRNGVVELKGVLSDERQRGAIKVIAENAPGVTAIHDHLVWVDGNSGAYLLSEEDREAQSASA